MGRMIVSQEDIARLQGLLETALQGVPSIAISDMASGILAASGVLHGFNHGGIARLLEAVSHRFRVLLFAVRPQLDDVAVGTGRTQRRGGRLGRIGSAKRSGSFRGRHGRAFRGRRSGDFWRGGRGRKLACGRAFEERCRR